MENPDYDELEPIPQEGQLRYSGSVLQRWEWSQVLGMFDWFDVPTAEAPLPTGGNQQ